jgi:hypothetical protein
MRMSGARWVRASTDSRTIPSATANGILHSTGKPRHASRNKFIMTAKLVYYGVLQSVIPTPSRSCNRLTVSRHACNKDRSELRRIPVTATIRLGLPLAKGVRIEDSHAIFTTLV